MKRVLVAAAATLVALSLSAASPAEIESLRTYATKALARCPDAKVTVEPTQGLGPQNFEVFKVTLKSSDENCNRQTYLLYSPLTRQVLIATVFPLPADGRPVTQRIAERSSELLKQQMTVTIAKQFPLPDGLRQVAMTKPTEWGPFSYHGYIDASEHFLIVGTRGNLNTPPGQTLLESINAASGAKRGNKAAKVEIVELSDFQCPTCGRAHKKIEPIIAKNLSKVNYTRIDLPLFEHHEWSIPAALGARAIQRVAPAKYWNYVDFIFTMQEAISREKFDEILKNFCSDNDISWPAVEKIYHSPQERAAILDQVSRAFDNSVISTPTYIVNGQQIGFGPEGTFTIETIKKAIGVK